MKNEKIVLNVYRDLYLNSEPSVDFDSLVENATINERGEKVINFLNYEITQEKQDEIFKKHLSKKRLTELAKNQITLTVLLGCSPKTKLK